MMSAVPKPTSTQSSISMSSAQASSSFTFAAASDERSQPSSVGVFDMQSWAYTKSALTLALKVLRPGRQKVEASDGFSGKYSISRGMLSADASPVAGFTVRSDITSVRSVPALFDDTPTAASAARDHT